MKCKDCPHLQYCAEDHQIDLYMDGYFEHDMYECDITLSDTYETIPEFLETEAWKHCSEELKKTMDEIDPKHKIY